MPVFEILMKIKIKGGLKKEDFGQMMTKHFIYQSLAYDINKNIQLLEIEILPSFYTFDNIFRAYYNTGRVLIIFF